MKKKSLRRAACLPLLLIIIAFGWNYLVNGSYPAGGASRAALRSDAQITVLQEGDLIAFVPDAPRRGFIFYPGGRVDHAAYAPLMRALAEEGFLCALLKMPLDLAVLDMNAAADVPARFPQIDGWVIGGHSLGGAMAASHAARQMQAYDALVLLAAYATDEAPSGMQALSLYGENDGVLNMEKYAQYRGNLPDDALEIVIPGGNHALFGDYGAQKGDGEAAISAEEQIGAVVQAMRSLL